MITIDRKKSIVLACNVLRTEANAILEIEQSIGDDFIQACEILANCNGHIVLIGIGKSGHIANKIASTLASTGSRAFYLHPTEAAHGDFGMLSNQDVAVILSNSGETGEVNALFPSLHQLGVTIIAITSNSASTLAHNAEVCINTHIKNEACPINLAPTTSTTAALAVGDALALTVMDAKGFTAEKFALSHPGGRLGRRLLLKVEHLMHSGDAIPIVSIDTLLTDALYEISTKRLGMTLITDESNSVIGIFTDGDLRRVLDKNSDIHALTIAQVMTKDFHTIQVDTSALEALTLMEEKMINSLPILDHDNNLVGAINIHDLLSAEL